jgi:hypothetical protein
MPENNEILFRDTKQIQGTHQIKKIHEIIECFYQLLGALILYAICPF